MSVFYTISADVKAQTFHSDISALSDAELEKYIAWAESIIDSIVTRVAPHPDNTSGRVFPRICDDGIPAVITIATQKLSEILFLKKMTTAESLQGAGGLKSERVSADGYSYEKGDLSLPDTDMYLTPEIKSMLQPYILNETSQTIC